MTKNQKVLIENNYGLIFKVLKDLSLDVEDWHGIAAIGLCKAAKAYDKSKGLFTTLAYTVIRNELLKELKLQSYKSRWLQDVAYKYYKPMASGVEFLEIMEDSVNIEKDIVNKLYVNEILNKLSEIDRLIVLMTADGYIQEDISKTVGLSKQGVSARLKRLRAKLTKLGIYE